MTTRWWPTPPRSTPVIAMVRQVAIDYGKHGVRINALCPGWVDTPFNDPFIRQMGGRAAIDAYVRDKIPLGRWASPDEIAEAILSPASDRSAFMTGHALVLDGGEFIFDRHGSSAAAGSATLDRAPPPARSPRRAPRAEPCLVANELDSLAPRPVELQRPQPELRVVRNHGGPHGACHHRRVDCRGVHLGVAHPVLGDPRRAEHRPVRREAPGGTPPSRARPAAPRAHRTAPACRSP